MSGSRWVVQPWCLAWWQRRLLLLRFQEAVSPSGQGVSWSVSQARAGMAAAGSGAGLVAQLDELGEGPGGVVAGLGVLADADGFEQVEQPLA